MRRAASRKGPKTRSHRNKIVNEKRDDIALNRKKAFPRLGNENENYRFQVQCHVSLRVFSPVLGLRRRLLELIREYNTTNPLILSPVVAFLGGLFFRIFFKVVGVLLRLPLPSGEFRHEGGRLRCAKTFAGSV